MTYREALEHLINGTGGPEVTGVAIKALKICADLEERTWQELESKYMEERTR